MICVTLSKLAYILSGLILYRVSQEERSIFWNVTMSVILSKKYICACVLFRKASEIELVHFTLNRRATRHVVTRVSDCIDAEGGIFENVLY
jgi:hypothetical protein